jgi:WhiB family redox-sensing transcriptional regulator
MNGEKPNMDDWADQARCRGEDTNIFYPVTDSEVRAAKEICEICVVRKECLEFALATRQKDGVWGGQSERDRRRILRKRRESAAN